MSFKKNWTSNKIISSDGYVVKILSRTMISYEDGSTRVYINAEHLAPRRTWAVFFDDMRVDAEDGRQLTDENLRKLIAGRVVEVFAFLDWKIE